MPRIIRSPQSRGFTLIELLVVIAIIAVLHRVASAGDSEKSASRRSCCTQCQSNMRQIGIALHTCRRISTGQCRRCGTTTTRQRSILCQFHSQARPGISRTTKGRATVHFALLPFIDEETLIYVWYRGNQNESYGYNSNTTVGVYTPKLYLCPSDPSGIQPNGQALRNGNRWATNDAINTQVFYQTTAESTVVVPRRFLENHTHLRAIRPMRTRQHHRLPQLSAERHADAFRLGQRRRPL